MTSWLFPRFGNYEESCYKHPCVGFSVDIIFQLLWKNAKEYSQSEKSLSLSHLYLSSNSHPSIYFSIHPNIVHHLYPCHLSFIHASRVYHLWHLSKHPSMDLSTVYHLYLLSFIHLTSKYSLSSLSLPPISICLSSVIIICHAFPRWLSGKESAYNSGDLGSIPGSGRSPGGGHSNLSRILAWRISMDRGAWWATVPGIQLDTTK